MGDSSVYCGISKITITGGMDVVLIPLSSERILTRTGMYHTPFCLPIFGENDNYGRIENIVEDVNTKLIEEHYNCTIQEFCNKLTQYGGVRDPDGRMSNIPDLNYMWIDRKVWDYMKSYRPTGYGRAESLDLGHPEILTKLGFKFINETDDKEYNLKYEMIVGENTISLLSNGAGLKNLKVFNTKSEKIISQNNYCYGLDDLEKCGVCVSYFRGKFKHHFYKFFDKRMRSKLFGVVLGININYRNYPYKFKKFLDNEPIISDEETPFNVIALKLMDMIMDNNYVCDTLCDMLTVDSNMYAGSMKYEPYVEFSTPQYGEYKIHQNMLEKFAEINKTYIKEQDEE
jgi:hypothetical protein